MKVLVTGGHGFIGGAVLGELDRRGHYGIVFSLPHGDIRRPVDVYAAMAGFDAVIHMAGVLGTHELFDDPQLAIDSNVTGTLNVLEACRRQGAAYVGITMPDVFPSIYTATKVAATRLARAFHHTHGVPVSHVRAFNAFGPGQAHGRNHPQKIIPTFAVAAWRQQSMPIWGDGRQTVDLIHVDQLARLLVDCLDIGGDDYVVDGGTGVAQTVADVAICVDACLPAEARGSQAIFELLPMRRGETPTHIVATGEGWERLDWKPHTVPLNETVWWYKERATNQ